MKTLTQFRPIPALGLTFVLASALQLQAEIERKIDFVKDVKPIFEAACIGCHGENEEERGGEYRMDTKKAAFEGGKSYGGETIVPGKANYSPVWWMTTLIPDDGDDYDEVMPPDHQVPLNRQQQDVIEAWIKQGAEWPDSEVLAEGTRVDFVAGLGPAFYRGEGFDEKTLEVVKLWSEQGAAWRENVRFGGDGAEDPGNASGEFAKVWPLFKRGGPFSDEEVQTVRAWAAAGAEWQEGFNLGEGNFMKNPDNPELVAKIHAKIVATSKEKAEGDMKAYTDTITQTDVTFDMVPIKGGKFMLGSPDSEKHRDDNEGPQKEVEIKPFWMGKFEVSWDEYEPFMSTEDARNKDGSRQTWSADDALEDLVSKPTTAYTEMSFGMGIKGFPAISQTQHAALKFCEWISAQTGHFYRLPTEAEWEYACRAGTTTMYSWGDDPDEADKYAWFYDNANDKYQKIGEKLPNPWGLHDMHGNVLEWTLDGYLPEAYGAGANDASLGVFTKPGKDLYPRVVRGGSWYDYVEDLRSAKRFKTHHSWKREDPQLPKSIWYLTDAQWLGMRLVRPLETPSAEEMHEIWNRGRGEENEIED